MLGSSAFSFSPYKPLLFDCGDIYVSRIVPKESSIHLEWLGDPKTEYSVFFRKKDSDLFIDAGKCISNEFDITNLDEGCDYEFYVESCGKRSRTRLARVGKCVGTVVNYLHPDDNAYSFSGKYLCSPSLLIHPDGYMLSAMDLFASGHPQNLTLIFRSDDEGDSWHYVSELNPAFWSKLFYHKGSIYVLTVTTEYGDLLIAKSDDGAKSFTDPVTLLRGYGGKAGSIGVHKNPQNMIIHNGRIYGSLEYGSWGNKEFGHTAMMMSADVDSDLLSPESWSFTEPRKFDRFTEELSDLPMNTMTIEGTPVISRDGEILCVMRFGKRGQVLAYKMDENDPQKTLTYHSLIDFPANFSKFMIKYDEVSDTYFSVATTLYDGSTNNARNYLTLLASRDLKKFEVVKCILDYRNIDTEHIGFQYVDFEFSGEDIIFLCRTAFNGAHSYHDSNYQTFHRIKNFRDLP